MPAPIDLLMEIPETAAVSGFMIEPGAFLQIDRLTPVLAKPQFIAPAQAAIRFTPDGACELLDLRWTPSVGQESG